MSKKFLISGIIIIVCLIWSFNVSAQVRETDVTIELYPELPTQNQEVKAVLKTNTTDLNKAFITWSVNNERRSAGVGKVEFYFNTEKNIRVNVTASIDTVAGQSIIKNRSITPASVDLIWEAVDSYTPPFYKGKAMVEGEGFFKVVAIPELEINGERVHSANLSYSWEKDRQVQSTHSGWGKDFFVFKNSYLDRGNVVKVFISDVFGNVSTGAEIFISPVNPKIVFYEKDPVLGLKLERAVRDGYFIPKEGVVITAAPYFITPKSLNAVGLEWSWVLGGKEVTTPFQANEMPIRPENNQSGVSTIKLNITNTEKIFSGVEKEINVSF